jgi:CheY-like chemotaxis protein
MPQVLIVEDDPNDAYFIKRAFELSGIKHTPHICLNITAMGRIYRNRPQEKARQNESTGP